MLRKETETCMIDVNFLALERKISVRANRDELIQKGILLPESPIPTIMEPGNVCLVVFVCLVARSLVACVVSVVV